MTYGSKKDCITAERLLLNCIHGNLWSKIYDDRGVDIDFYNRLEDIDYAHIVPSVISRLGLNYYKDISDYIISVWLTKEKPLYMGRTSGTSDGNNGGKDIPVTATSLDILERDAIWNTLYCVAQFDLKNIGKVLSGKALILSASFDGYRGYISGIIRHNAKSFADRIVYPSHDINKITDIEDKKKAILIYKNIDIK